MKHANKPDSTDKQENEQPTSKNEPKFIKGVFIKSGQFGSQIIGKGEPATLPKEKAEHLIKKGFFKSL